MTGAASPLPSGFIEREAAGDGSRYRVYVPAHYSSRRRWPVILFLHGAGERGRDGVAQTTLGLGPALLRFPERYPALVVFPQAHDDEVWAGAAEQRALAALDATLHGWRVDPRRIYLGGVSMGGYGAWRIAARFPGRFAALVVVCGGVGRSPSVLTIPPPDDDGADPYCWVADRLGGTPAWLFHGADDPVVPVEESRRMAALLRERGAPVRYSELAGIGHDAWDPAFTDPALPPWLFTQRNPSPRRSARRAR